jgi:hypothetical protein
MESTRLSTFYPGKWWSLGMGLPRLRHTRYDVPGMLYLCYVIKKKEYGQLQINRRIF